MAATNRQIIQFHRHLGATLAPAALEEGEPALNDTGAAVTHPANFYIGGQGGGAAVRTIVSPLRQVEIAGAQTITGTKTIDVAHLRLLGGAAPGDFLTLVDETTGEIDWASLPAGGLLTVSVTAGTALTGNGTPGTPLNFTVATYGTAADQVELGANNVFPITSASLRHISGNLTNLTVPLAARTDLVTAINSVVTSISALESAVQLVGTIDIATNAVVPVVGAPAAIVAGPLPTAAAAGSGSMVIVTTAGPGGVGNIPAGPFANGDFLISNGTTWVPVSLNLGTMSAININVNAITGITVTNNNVQEHLENLYNLAADAIAFVDNQSITGIQGPTATGPGLTAANALAVHIVDGGLYT